MRCPAMTARPSLLLVLATVAIIVAFVDFSGSGGGVVERSMEALAMIGAIGGLLHGIGFQPASPVVRALQNPRFAWPAMLAGSLYLVLR